MYGRRPVADAKRASRAILSNLLARGAPRLYVRLIGETGRGQKKETPESVAAYFRNCFEEYFQKLDLNLDSAREWLEGRVLLEYGPGDVPGVSLLMLAHGARKVFCVDRFSLDQRSPFQVAVLQEILDGLDGEVRQRGEECFVRAGDPASGFKPECLEYRVTKDGLSGLTDSIDLVYSRAVLEHVNDLDATFDDMAKALKWDGVAIHQVDLKSHGLHRENPLDFLTWPPLLWNLMYEGKGVPNRLRLDRYVQALTNSGLTTRILEPTAHADQEDIDAVRPYLAKPFRDLDDETLRCLGFWLVAEKHPGEKCQDRPDG